MSKTIRTQSGKIFDPVKAKEIAAGGEGRILEDYQDKGKVVKLYFKEKNTSFQNHLEALSKLGSDFVKPQDIYFNIAGKLAGFSMDYVNLSHYFLFNKLFDKNFCATKKITKEFKVRILDRVRKNLEELHGQDIQVGDCNPYNIFFSLKGEVLFVDVDSFQTKSQKHSNVILEDVKDWKQPFTVDNNTDAWAFAILCFQALTYCHPFQWNMPANSDSIEEKTVKGHSLLSKLVGMKIPMVYEEPAEDLKKQFLDIFGGRRYLLSLDKAPMTSPMVVKIPVPVSAELTIRVLYEDITQVYAYYDMVSAKTTKGHWRLLRTNLAKTVDLIYEVVDAGIHDIFPSKENYVVRRNNQITFENHQFFDFSQPVFYYKDGALSVFDYGTNKLWNFDLNNQEFGAAFTNSAIYAKSVIVRDAPIQSYGGTMYLNLPNEARPMMLSVLSGTKNAWCAGDYIAVEYTHNNKVKYALFDHNLRTTIDLDYFPYFAARGNLVLVPDDECINIYINGNHSGKLSCPVCTRQSRLYSTQSGILLLENNVLYLLNTK